MPLPISLLKVNKVRIDKYLWAIRICKTRTLAASLCDRGRVRISNVSVKASRMVNPGDEIWIKKDEALVVIKVLKIIDKRVGFDVASTCYLDRTPEGGEQAEHRQASVFYTGKRKTKIGRPTKKERRDLDDFMDL